MSDRLEIYLISSERSEAWPWQCPAFHRVAVTRLYQSEFDEHGECKIHKHCVLKINHEGMHVDSNEFYWGNHD